MEDKLTNLLIAGILIIVIALAGIYAYKLFDSSQKNQSTELSYNYDYTYQNKDNNSEAKVEGEKEQIPSTQIVIPLGDTETKSSTDTGKNTNSSQSNNVQAVTTTVSSYQYNNRYYYNQLEECEKTIYNVLEKNIDKLKTGNATIAINYDFAPILNQKDGNEKLKAYYGDAVNALNMDIPNLFYIDLSKLCLRIEKSTSLFGSKYTLYIDTGDFPNYYAEGFYSETQIEKAINSIEAIKQHVLKDAKGDNYSKIKSIHDWIIEYLSYSSDSSNKGNIYGAFIEKKAVCEGYARTCKYLLDSIGIENVLVIGIATNSSGNTEDHMWNYVKMNNVWYMIDCTWDDPIVYGGGTIGHDIKHRYFMVGSNDVSESHVEKGVISQDGKEFVLPILSKFKY